MTIPSDDLCVALRVTVDNRENVNITTHARNVIYLSPRQMRELVAWWQRREQGEETLPTARCG